MKMWSGRFREPLDPFFDHWQRSIHFDRQILIDEARASKAHALALQAAGVLTADECSKICAALSEITKTYASLSSDTPGYKDAEDIHHFVELKLVELLGNLGLKLHTGRSRNEQIATDLRLHVRDRIGDLLAHLASLGRAAGRASQGGRRCGYARLHPSATGRTCADRPLAAGLCRDVAPRCLAS